MKLHDVQQLLFIENELMLTVDGETRRFALSEISLKLAKATPAERERYEISPSGYGIHWPLIDEDLSIDGLLGITHMPQFACERAA